MTNGRNKGAQAEREIIKIIQPVVDRALCDYTFEIKRNLTQTREGGCDIATEHIPEHLDFVAIEIKRCEKLEVKKWWAQAKRQTKRGQIPVLIYRQSRQPWKVVTVGKLIADTTPTTVTISLQRFLDWYEQQLLRRNKKYSY